MDELEESLKRLFQDPRLDMRAAPDADEKVVAGARRVRRNRIAMITSAGVMSLAVLAGGTFLLASPAGPEPIGPAVQPSDLPIESSINSPTSERAPDQLPSPATTTTRSTPIAPAAPTSTKAQRPPGATVTDAPTRPTAPRGEPSVHEASSTSPVKGQETSRR
jgi:hypothetical protein